VSQSLARWIDANRYRWVGYPREINHECPAGEPEKWVTELQAEIAVG
jgi:hypothetical protein